eukprot:723568-Rhodomonas_salina.1
MPGYPGTRVPVPQGTSGPANIEFLALAGITNSDTNDSLLNWKNWIKNIDCEFFAFFFEERSSNRVEFLPGKNLPPTDMPR